jgi:hypothetical protein
VTLDAGTAMEHLLKACLAKRSPALLTELRSEANFDSLLQLLDIPECKQPLRQLRTVGVRDALVRVRMFVKSSVAEADLRTLADMRDGTVHAAMGVEVEERLMVAFLRHADALLADLKCDRAEFWGAQLAVVDALLADASDKVGHRVGVKLAAARASFERLYAQVSAEALEIARRIAQPRVYEANEAPSMCPACESTGVATGARDIEMKPGRDEAGRAHGVELFNADGFTCQICGLVLDSADELTAAGMESSWEEGEVSLAPPPNPPPLTEAGRAVPGYQAGGT